MTPEEERLDAISARLSRVEVLGPWGIMLDGPHGDGKPWLAFREAAPGLTVGAANHTEPVARMSGYLMSAEANAELVANAPADLRWLVDRCRVLEERNAELTKQRDASDSERLDVVERCIKAEARVASLSEDALRIDWLASGRFLAGPVDNTGDYSWKWDADVTPSELRKAIDAARSSSGSVSPSNEGG